MKLDPENELSHHRDSSSEAKPYNDSFVHFETSTAAADSWLDRAERAVDSLGEHPERCPLAPEASSFDKLIRQLLFGAGNRGTYRLLFEIIGQTVYVLHVRHGSRLPLSPDE